MDLIEAIKIGFEGKRLARGKYYRFNKAGKVTQCCPLGAAALACGLEPDPKWDINTQSIRVCDQLEECGIEVNWNQKDFIFDAVDKKKWSLEQILEELPNHN